MEFSSQIIYLFHNIGHVQQNKYLILDISSPRCMF